MQLVKHVFKNNVLKFSFPDEVIYKILNYTVKYCLISRYLIDIKNFEQLKQNCLKSVLQKPIIHFSIKPYCCTVIRQRLYMVSNHNYKLPDDQEIIRGKFAFCISAVSLDDITKNAIVDLKKIGLIHFDAELMYANEDDFNRQFIFSDQKRVEEGADHNIYAFSISDKQEYAYYSYLFYKTFNAHPHISLIFENRYSDMDYNNQIRDDDLKKCFVKLFDRNVNAQCGLFEFDDYIKNCFCSENLLFIELVEQKIQATGYGRIFQKRSNHRIEIYDIQTHEKIFKFSLALAKKIDNKSPEGFLSELVYVDREYIYLKKIENNKVFSVKYYDTISNISFENFFIEDNTTGEYSQELLKLEEENLHKKNYLQCFLYFVKSHAVKFLLHICGIFFLLDEKEHNSILKIIVKD